MPILIQELIASDSISQAVDKINFNFDQILLNGGGPVGPPGPLGPPGPIGGRGERGSLWYEDSTSSPGTDPNLLTFTGLVIGDNYLQANGDVWSWSGLTWSITSINLLGPQGPAGSSGAWLKFGSDIGVSNINRNAIYPEPFGQANGANNANEGISTVVIGAVVSSTPLPSSPITPTNALISNVLAAQIDSGIVASIIHQKTSGARAIMFHGGVDALDYYEQSIISNLANISLETDDTMSVNIPKRLIDPQSSLIGYSLNTTASGQLFRSGRDITFNTGLDTTLYNLTSVPDSSNFNVNAKQIPGLTYPEINFNQYDSSNINQARVQIGGDVGGSEPVRSNVNSGKIVADACFTYVFGRSIIRLRGNQIDLFADNAVSVSAPTAITLTSPSINNVGNVSITGNIYVNGTGVINGNLQTNANLQVGLNSNLLGALTVNGLSTLSGEVILGTVNAGSGDVLVRNTSTNKIEKLTGAAPIPLGGIIMWSGSISSIPAGWGLCDGTVQNGSQTPDLRERFIVGAGGDSTSVVSQINYDSFSYYHRSTNGDITGTFPTFSSSTALSFSINSSTCYIISATGQLQANAFSIVIGSLNISPQLYVKASPQPLFMAFDSRVMAYRIFSGTPTVGNTYSTNFFTFKTNIPTWSSDFRYFTNGIRVGIPEYISTNLTMVWPDGGGYNVGDTGGLNNTRIGESQLTPHKHKFSDDASNSTNALRVNNDIQVAIPTGGPISATGTGGGGLIYQSESKGGYDRLDNRPPYYALAFIMYIGT